MKVSPRKDGSAFGSKEHYDCIRSTGTDTDVGFTSSESSFLGIVPPVGFVLYPVDIRAKNDTPKIVETVGYIT